MCHMPWGVLSGMHVPVLVPSLLSHSGHSSVSFICVSSARRAEGFPLEWEGKE